MLVWSGWLLLALDYEPSKHEIWVTTANARPRPKQTKIGVRHLISIVSWQTRLKDDRNSPKPPPSCKVVQGQKRCCKSASRIATPRSATKLHTHASLDCCRRGVIARGGLPCHVCHCDQSHNKALVRDDNDIDRASCCNEGEVADCTLRRHHVARRFNHMGRLSSLSQVRMH